MLRKRNIVESTTPPSIDSLWLNKGIAKVFINGKWVTIPDLSGYAKLTDIGTEESFVFTLENGSKVTKSIRIISTTNS